ncbi:TonB-dependent receptor [Flavobacteriaceae bacterium Ap0902]|nr:TonB-dependent receptor [Flavobacteriaceae bacterium Ap0902]
MKGKFLIFAILAGLSFSEAQEHVALDSLVTSGRVYPMASNKVNESYIVISKENLQSTPIQSIEEAIAYHTGIDLRRRGIDGMQSDISIRGGSFEQVLLLINGVRVTNPQTAHNLWSLPFNLTTVERIEIIKGPSATKYGANAYAGVINVVTKIDAENSGHINITGGSFGTYQANVGMNVGKGKLKHGVNASYGASDGYRHNTDYTKKNMFYQNSYGLENGEIKFQAGFGEKKFGANGFYASPKFTEQYEETQNSIVSIGLNQKINHWGIQAKTYWTRAQDKYILIKDKPGVYRNMHIGNNLGAELSTSIQHNLGVTSFGADYRKEMLRSNNLGSRDRDILSVFAEHHFILADGKLNIVPGISWADFSNTGDFFYPSLEIGYHINAQHKLYGNASKVHREPSYTELFYNSRTEVGNADLKPESAKSYEIGYKFAQPGFLAQISAFYRDADDAIDWVKNDENDVWRAFNNAQVETKGIEINVKKDFVGFMKSFALGYTYLDKSFENTNYNFSKYALENLKNQVVVSLENRLTPELTTMISYRYLDRVTMDNYSLLDAKLNYTHSNWSVFTSINNILDTTYTESSLVEMPGFWFSAGATYNFKF